MIDGKQVTGLLFIKGHSRRVPNKNLRDFCGRPLMCVILDTLQACPLIDRVVVDTDTPAVADIAARYSKAAVIDRPGCLLGDHVVANELIAHEIQACPSDIYVQTHTTNPLLRAETIARAIGRYASLPDAHDTLMGVTRCYERYWDAESRPVNHDPRKLVPTQELPPFYVENSCLYIFSPDAFRRNGNRIGERPFLFEIDPAEAIDIDTMQQFMIAEFCFQNQRSASGAGRPD